MGILKKIFNKVAKTGIKIDDIFFEELEEILIEAYVGVKTTQDILNY